MPGWVPGGAVAAIAGFLFFLAKTIAILLVLASVKVMTGRIRIRPVERRGLEGPANAALLQVGIVLVMAAWGVAR